MKPPACVQVAHLIADLLWRAPPAAGWFVPISWTRFLTLFVQPRKRVGGRRGKGWLVAQKVGL